MVGLAAPAWPVLVGRPASSSCRRKKVFLFVDDRIQRIKHSIRPVIAFAVAECVGNAETVEGAAIAQPAPERLRAAEVHMRLGVTEDRAIGIPALERFARGIEFGLGKVGAADDRDEIETTCTLRAAELVTRERGRNREVIHVFVDRPLRSTGRFGSHRQAPRTAEAVRLRGLPGERIAELINGITQGIKLGRRIQQHIADVGHFPAEVFKKCRAEIGECVVIRRQRQKTRLRIEKKITAQRAGLHEKGRGFGQRGADQFNTAVAICAQELATPGFTHGETGIRHVVARSGRLRSGRCHRLIAAAVATAATADQQHRQRP